MIVRNVFISDFIKAKIANKHKVDENEIREIIFHDKPIFKKSRGNYLCTGFKERYLTIIFKYKKENKEAKIITAYPSSTWQINLYKKMKK